MDADKLLVFALIYEKNAKRKGRSDKAVKKQYKTMTEGEEHPFKHLLEKFKNHPEIDDPKGLAAWMKDKGEGTKKWRTSPKKKKKV